MSEERTFTIELTKDKAKLALYALWVTLYMHGIDMVKPPQAGLEGLLEIAKLAQRLEAMVFPEKEK